MTTIDTLTVKVTVDEIRRDLPAYLSRVEAGETVIILRAGEPLAELKPATPTSKPARPFGLCAGEFVVPANFDDPLPEGIAQEFEGR